MLSQSLQKYFQQEWERLKNWYNEDEITIKTIEEFKSDIESILKKFSDQNHSGLSAAFFSNIISELIKRALQLRPLVPMTKDEIMQNIDPDIGMCKICRSIFIQDGKPYYSDAIIWRDQNGAYFTGDVQGIPSSQFINFDHNNSFIDDPVIIDVIHDHKTDDYTIQDYHKFELMRIWEEKRYHPTLYKDDASGFRIVSLDEIREKVYQK